jgi:putative ABC transport system ATP-binding protein
MKHEPTIQARDVSKIYGSGHTEVRAVDKISLTIAQGELVLIMGPSGSGKTTLLSMLGGLLRPTSGQIVIEGTDITALDESSLPNIRARKIGFIFQSFNLLDALNIEENILFPSVLVPEQKDQARKRANELIELLNLSRRRRAVPGTLSGGEKQRVAIARALINNPPLILADEPTGNLDSQSGQDVTMILHDIARDEGCAVVLVTHDPRVEDVADRILWLEDGALRDRRSEKHAWVHCPVCNMRVDEWTATLHVDYKGRKFVFCSVRCQERFQNNPSAFVDTKAKRI